MAEQVEYTYTGGVKSFKGARAGESFAGAAELKKRKREEEYSKSLPKEATGLGGAAWRSSAAGKKHRADWEAKNPEPMNAPPKKKEPGLSDLQK